MMNMARVQINKWTEKKNEVNTKPGYHEDGITKDNKGKMMEALRRWKTSAGYGNYNTMEEGNEEND
eukprot:6184574-Pleurochrysis_carterae.AAC.6